MDGKSNDLVLAYFIKPWEHVNPFPRPTAGMWKGVSAGEGPRLQLCFTVNPPTAARRLTVHTPLPNLARS